MSSWNKKKFECAQLLTNSLKGKEWSFLFTPSFCLPARMRTKRWCASTLADDVDKSLTQGWWHRKPEEPSDCVKQT